MNTYYKVTLKGSGLSGWIIFSSIDAALDSLKYDLSELSVGGKVKVNIEVVEMTQEEFKALPEFDGF